MQDIIPYYQLRQQRQRSMARLRYDRPVAVTHSHIVRVEPNQTVEVTDTYVYEPAPMTRPIEALTPEEKIQVLERALVRARQTAKAERRRRLFA